MTRRGKAELALAFVTMIWGTSFVMVKSALNDVSPLVFIGIRFTLAFVVMLLIYGSAIRKRGISPGLLAGVLLFLAFTLQTIGLRLTTPPKSAFLTSLSIPMVPLASSIVYKVRPRVLEAIGILLASLGMVLMTLPDTLLNGKLELSRGDLLTFLCAIFFALHIVVIGHFSTQAGFQSLAVMQLAVVAGLAISLGFLVEPPVFRLTPAVAVAVLVTGLLGTAMAFTTMAWAQQYTTATRAALIFALEPVVAWLTSYWWAGESMGNRGKVGAGLILAGILLVELKPGNKPVSGELSRVSGQN